MNINTDYDIGDDTSYGEVKRIVVNVENDGSFKILYIFEDYKAWTKEQLEKK